jgi:malate/lactate dehydrogenase
VAIVDVDEKRLMGEMMDMQDGLDFLQNGKVTASTGKKESDEALD